MLTYGTATIYTSFDKNAKSRLPLRLTEAIQKVTKKQIPKFKRFIAIGISGNSQDGIDCLLPDVRYYI